jgi:integrase
MTTFNSPFRKELEDFLSLRQASLSKSAYAHDCHYLADFDAFAARYTNEKSVSEALINNWIHTLNGKSSSIANKVIVIRIFLKYLNSIGITAYIPPIPKVADDYVPYIFSDEELERIYQQADNLNVSNAKKNPLIQFEFPMVIRLMYGCGLRIGETLALKMRDVDLIGGFLIMRHTKGNKQRLVPMNPLLTEILERYCLAMGIVGVPDAWLFPVYGKDESMTPRDAQHWFEKILRLAEISFPGRKKHERGPCLHCMRHAFVFKSFIAAEKAGRRIDDSVPYLSIYLGHDSLQETEKYMKFSSELFPEAMDLFSDYSADVFPEVAYET